MAIQFQMVVMPLPISAELKSLFEDILREANILGKMKFFYVAAKGLTTRPTNGDLVDYEGFKWEIKGVITLNPGGVDIMHTVVCEQGGQLP